MTVKTSISLPDRQLAFAKDMVERGKFPSVSAVVQHGVELLREKTVQEDEERQAFSRWIEERMRGPTISLEEFRVRLARDLEESRADLIAEFGAKPDVDD